MREGGFTLGLALAKGLGPESGLHGVLSVRDRGGSRADVILTALPGPAPRPVVPFGRALVFAFLGGIILNLMPCVFPILAMKAVGFAAGLARGQARAHAISYTCGVTATFVGVALALDWPRDPAGLAVAGWGFQFASPIFVTAMAWVLFAVGLESVGHLSGWRRDLAGAGSQISPARDQADWGSFFTGALAVLVATPCTAPFMAVAIASGLAAPPAVTVLIFLVMGLGLASPYLALSAIPALATIIAAPGAVDGGIAAIIGVSDVRGGRLAALGGQSGGRRFRRSRGRDRLRSSGLRRMESRDHAGFQRFRGAAGSDGSAPASAGRSWHRPGGAGGIELGTTPAAAVAERGSEPFTPARLAALRAEGRPVFVNLTAAWVRHLSS